MASGREARPSAPKFGRHRFLLAGLLALQLSAAEPGQPAADAWVTNAVRFPPPASVSFVRSNFFSGLHAEVIAGRLKILWPLENLSTNATVLLHASADELGHWPARDWHARPLTAHGPAWEATVPIEDPDLPLVYFVSSVENHATNLSPMRVCLPRAAGLERPTRIFWPFLEGFEEGTESWRLLSPDLPPSALKTDANAKNGRAALLVALPAGKRSAMVGTTRLRGAQIQRESATGVRLWLRTRAGVGRARFTLQTHAGTTNQIATVFPEETALDEHWQKVDLPFSAVRNVPLGSVDFFIIEFAGEGPREFLIDDVQLLGPWRLEPE